MDISTFTERLYSAIIEKGIDQDAASAYIKHLEEHLRPEDVENATDVDIEESVNICLESMKNGSVSKTDGIKTSDAFVPSNPDAFDDDLSDDNSGIENDSDFINRIFSDAAINDTSDVATEVFDTPVPKDTSVKFDIDPPSIEIDEANDGDLMDEYIPEEEPSGDGKKVKSSPRGIAMLILITVVSSPLWLIASALFIAPFAAMFAAEFAFTAALVCVLAGVAAIGAAAALTGIIYGIVLSFTDSITGIYEIGFGIILAGVTMIVCILVYNCAVRFMPWVIKKTKVLFKFAFSKVKILLNIYKRWCMSL